MTRKRVRQRMVHLPHHDPKGVAGLSLHQCLANADDGLKPSSQSRADLGRHIGVGLVMQGASLGMPEDHQMRPRVSAASPR